MTRVVRGEAEMLVRIALLAFVLLAGACGPASAATYFEVAKRLDGEWRGDTFVLRIDAKRAQASTASDRPFEWQRFLIKEVHDDEVVFTIGAELFQAVVSDDALTLTGTSFRGARVLFRGSDLRGTTD
jgi:hypothetical protein